MSADELAKAVEKYGALPVPVPVGPEPQALSVERLAEIAAELGHVAQVAAEATGWRLEDYQAVRGALHSARLLVTEAGRLSARVAELEAERHSTNEALSAAAEALRADRDAFETVRALCDAADAAGITSGGWFTVEAIRKALGIAAPDAMTKVFVPVASLREPDGEHYGLVHHDWRLGRDLPETGSLQ